MTTMMIKAPSKAHRQSLAELALRSFKRAKTTHYSMDELRLSVMERIKRA
jgi:hypothetical protein